MVKLLIAIMPNQYLKTCYIIYDDCYGNYHNK